jgi:hypothetical protein
LLLLLLITATLIGSVDNMDEVYIPSFDMFLLNQNETAATTQNAYIKKLSDDSLLSCWVEWHLASMRHTSSWRA